MAIRENLIQARSLYVGVSPNVGPAASNLIVDGSVGIGTTSPANKLSVSSGAFNNGATVASILNTSSTQKAHVVYDTFLIQQDDAPTLRLYETLENLSTTISSDGGLTSFATTGEMGLFVAGSSTAPGWTGLNGIQAVRIKSNGYVGIGTTNPGTKLEVAGPLGGTVGVGGSTLRLVNTDTGNAASITAGITGLTNDGMQFSTDGTVRMIVASGGNVGIGTSSPSTKLQVNGTFASNALWTDASSIAYWGNYSTAYGGLTWDTGYGMIFSSGGNALRFGTNGANARMSIDTSGNVGIGTTSPGYKLEVNGTSYFSGLAYFGQTAAGGSAFRWGAYGTAVSSNTMLTHNQLYNGSGWTILDSGIGTTYLDLGAAISNPYISFGTGAANTEASEKMRITNSGNVGIGTTSPSTKFHVQGSNLMATFRNSSTSADQYTQLEFIAGSRDAYIWLGNQNTTSWAGDGGLNIYTGTGNMDFWTAATQKMRITSAGNVGIGTTSPSLDSGGTGLDILNASYTQLRVRSSTDSAGIEFKPASGDRWEVQANSSNQWFVYNRTDSEYRLLIDGSGNVGIGTTSPAKILELSQAEPYLRFNPTAVSGAYLLGAADGKFYFTPESTYVPTMTLSSGNVGIGTASPNQSKLHILKSESGSNPAPVLRIGNQGSGYTSRMILTDETTNSANISYLGATQSLGFSVGPSLNQMILTSTGNVGIGTTAPAAKLEIYGTGSTSSTVNFLIKNSSGVKIIESFDDGLIRLNNTLNINQAIYINNGNSNVHYALDSHIFSVVDDVFQRVDFVTIKGNLSKPAMGVGTMSPNSSAILDLTSISKGFLPPRMTNTEMNAIASPAAGLVVYDTTNNKLTVYNGSSWVQLH